MMSCLSNEPADDNSRHTHHPSGHLYRYFPTFSFCFTCITRSTGGEQQAGRQTPVRPPAIREARHTDSVRQVIEASMQEHRLRPHLVIAARPAVRLRSACQDDRVRFVLRGASAADVDGLLTMWAEAAENDSRPPDTHAAVTALLDRDPDAVILAEHDGELSDRSSRAGMAGGVTSTGSRYGLPGGSRGSVPRFSAPPRPGSRLSGRLVSTPWCSTATTSANTSGGPAATANRTTGAAG